MLYITSFSQHKHQERKPPNISNPVNVDAAHPKNPEKPSFSSFFSIVIYFNSAKIVIGGDGEKGLEKFFKFFRKFFCGYARE